MERNEWAEEARGVYGRLCRGRRPFASARILGTEACPTVSGWLSLYATPAGVAVFAELKGMPKGAVLRLCLEQGGGAVDGAFCLPLLYEREGSAWLACLTERLPVSARAEGAVCLTEAEVGGRVVAMGRLSRPAARCG